MGLVPTFFGIATKQRLLLGYANEIPSITAVRKISARSVKFYAKSGDLKREKMTKSLRKEKDHLF